MKKIIALILVVVSLFSVMSISVYAEGTEKNTITVTVNDIEFVFDEVSTVDDKKCDNILIPKKITKKSHKMIKNADSSDHFMCIIEI